MPNYFPPAATIRRIVTPIVKNAAKQLGAPVTFTRGGSVYNEDTRQMSGTAVAAAGHATRMKSDPAKMVNLGTLIDPITLLVPADELAGFVPQSETDAMTFAGVTYAVRLVEPLGSDGIPISFTVTGSR